MPLIKACVLTLMVLLAFACMASPSQDSPSSRDGSRDLPASVTALPGVKCERRRQGWDAECVYGDYQIATYPHGCSSDGTYGAIDTDGGGNATLLATFPHGEPVARLKKGQLVCVSADARMKTGDPQWYFVTAIPADSVKACAGKSLCGAPGRPVVEWTGPASGKACQLDASGHYTDGCAAGWVSANEFGEFSMGL